MQNPPPPLHPGLGPAASAPFVENLLPACNGQLDLRAAYTWNRDQVISFVLDNNQTAVILIEIDRYSIFLRP